MTGSITLEANGLVFGDRNADYGHPLDDFDCTAALWNAYLRKRGLEAGLVGEDIGMLMILLKVSRQAGKNKRDNLVDIAGYAETVQMTIGEREKRSQ